VGVSTAGRSALYSLLAAATILLTVIPTAPRGEFHDWDTDVKFAVARNFAEGNGMTLGQHVTPNDPFFVRMGVGGRRVSYFPFLACLAWLPTYWLEAAGGPLIAGLPPILALAATASLIFLWGRRLGLAALPAMLGALLTCIATPLWPSAAHEYDSGFEVLGFAAMLWAQAGSGRRRDWLVAGLLLGVSFGVRQTSALLAIPGVILVVSQEPRSLRPILVRFAMIALGMLPSLAGTMAYDIYRFGHPFWLADISSAVVPFLSADYSRGVAGMLVSPGKGIFWYSPVLLVAAAILPRLLRRWGAPVLALLSFLAVALLFYPRLNTWSGDWCWGSRYVLSLHLGAAPVVWWLYEWGQSRAALARWLLAAGACALALFQAIAISPQPVVYYFQRVVMPLARSGQLHGPSTSVPVPEDWGVYYFTLSNSPLVIQAQGFVKNLTGELTRDGSSGIAVVGWMLFIPAVLVAVHYVSRRAAAES